MAKIIRRENIRVEVIPNDYRSFFKAKDNPAWLHKEEQLLGTCEGIVAGIERHVDDVDTVGTCFDRVAYCSFCGSHWETHPQDGLPVCCNEAIDEMEHERDQEELPDESPEERDFYAKGDYEGDLEREEGANS